MIDLHCHILPGVDDGAADITVSLAMARAMVADGVTSVACTPHILPGVYANTGPQILGWVEQLQVALDQEDIPLQLLSGADVHMVPDAVAGLRSGQLLTLAGTRYVLIEPPHHVVPPRIEEFFFNLMIAGYVPILTHPERLSWIKGHYDSVLRLVEAGAWMQITAGSLLGDFGKSPQYWSEKMLAEGAVHILATDSHDTVRRPPKLAKGRDRAATLVGAIEAERLVLGRPQGIVANDPPGSLSPPVKPATNGARTSHDRYRAGNDSNREGPGAHGRDGSAAGGGFAERLRGLFRRDAGRGDRD